MPILQNPVPIAAPDSIPSVKQELEMMKTLPFDDFINQLFSNLVHFAINLGIAILVFYAGKFIIKRLHNLVRRIMVRRNVDQGLATFLLSMVRIVLYFILIVTVIGILGIETSSFLALFASAGVAIGMALSGTLQNFAGGVLILLLKPYRIGDYIEAQGYAGTVTEIQIFSTIICTYDNKSIIIPNGPLSTGSINNWSREKYRRIDWTVSIAYGDDFETARRAILAILAENANILRECPPEHTEPGVGHPTVPVDCSPQVLLDNLGQSSVDLKVRAWVLSQNYWSTFYQINGDIYTKLPASGIRFPFPQLDVHIDNGN